MRKYNELLKNIAGELNILQGSQEPVEMYKCRLIYSVLGRMAYAALWDIQEDGQPVSVIHFKRRISQLLYGYREIYPEIRSLLPSNNEQLSDEIYSIYIKTGYIYHSPNRLAPAVPCQSEGVPICLTRSMPLYLKQCVSGIGTYTMKVNSQFSMVPVQDMFMLQEIKDYWKEAVRGIQWSVCEDIPLLEFLRPVPPFNYGYWVDEPIKDNFISLARTKLPGSQLYYFYKRNGKQLLISPVPDWRIKEPVTQQNSNNYRLLANSLLDSLNTLPKIKYHMNGALVTISLDYLPDPATLNFIKLYSWPISFYNLSDFQRTCSLSIFPSLRETLERLGYQFTKE